ncbi:MAG: AAA family ATPase [Acidimicrobiia bacterium]|nr:AAA family ATPase [Acidimicrobiia bacterium]
MGVLQIRLLGGFSLEHDGKVLPPLPSRAARSLFALLVTQRGTTQTRDRLAGTFWPDLAEARARRRLSHALWQLQQVLTEVHAAEPFTIVGADTVRFNDHADYWLDIDEFEKLGSGTLDDMEAAIELYRGDFLAGSYDDWLLVEQQRLRGEYAALLQRAIAGHKSRGDISKALAVARRFVGHDPLNEEAHREVMRLSFLLGQFNDAIQQFEFCSSILEEELGEQPSAATRELYAEIMVQRTKGDRPFVPDPQSVLFRPGEMAMVGRVHERAAVIERMAGLFGGRGGVVLVEGASGAGVSRFLGGLAADAHWRGLGVMDAAARSSAIPYDLCRQALGDALSPLRTQQVMAIAEPVWLTAASAVLPALGSLGEAAARLDPAEEAERVAQALTEVLLALGRINPHVILLDDVHLADAETLAFLELAALRLSRSNVLLVLGYHSAEARDTPRVWETLLNIDAQPGVSRLKLEDLDAGETAELIRAATGSAPENSLIDSVFSQTGGNPLLVLETLRGMTQQPEFDEPLTEAAFSLLERRLRLAAPATLRVLQAASVFDSRVTVDSVVAVAGIDPAVALQAVDNAVRRAFLVEADDHLDFAHRLMKAATLKTIPDGDVSSLHRAAARQMVETDSYEVEEIARHLRESGQLELSAEYSIRAADRALEVFAHETAVSHFAAALAAASQVGTPDSQLVGMLLRYEQLLDQLARRQEQGSVLHRMNALDVDAATQVEIARRRVLYLANIDQFEEANLESTAALQLASEHGLPRGGLLAAHGLAVAWSGRPAEALPYLEQATADGGMSTAEIAEVRYSLGMAMSSLDHPRAVATLAEALRLFGELGHQRRNADVLGLMATNHASRGEIGLAESELQGAIDICEQIGFTQGEATNRANLASLHYLYGRPALALRGFEAVLAILASVPNPRTKALTLNNAAFVRHRVVGDDATASQQASEALEYYQSVGNPRGTAHAASILARIAARRDPSSALLLLAEHLEGFDMPGAWTTAHMNRTQAEVRLASGDLAGAREYCDLARAAAAEGDLTDALPTIAGLSAQVALAAGDKDRALEEARRAVANLGPAVEQPYLLHYTHYRAAIDHQERANALVRAYDGLQSALEGFTPSERLLAEAVPEHSAIIESWSAHFPIQRRVDLQQVDGSGALTVELTVAAPGDHAASTKPTRRRLRIVRMLAEAAEHGVVLDTARIASLLGVSPATVRRDIAVLRQED